MRKLLLAVATLALITQPALAATIDTTLIGTPNNDPDDTGFGAVNYIYAIGTYEVTNAQYAEFLNAVDETGANSLGLYNPNMNTFTIGGIQLDSGQPNGSKYVVKSDMGQKPVIFVSFYDALRFANWLNNGQGTADTETGSYTLSDLDLVSRNPGARWFLPSEDEWYKAAYYDAALDRYYDYPTGTDTQITCESAPGGTNSANCGVSGGRLYNVGSYSASVSPFGTYDQGGSLWEWTEEPGGDVSQRVTRGGSHGNSASFLAASVTFPWIATGEGTSVGFRVAVVPEPGTGLLVMAGLLGLVMRRRRLH